MSASTGRPSSAENVEQLLAAARVGSREALGQLFEACRPYLLLVANQTLPLALRGKVGASDLVQDTFVNAQRDFDRFKGGTEATWLAWLRQVLLNNIANHSRAFAAGMRDIGREIPLDAVGETVPATDSSTPSGRAAAREQAEALEHALAQLPEHYREVLRLRNQDGLSFEAIGERMERSSEAVRKLWARAVEQVQRLLEVSDESD